MTRGRLALGLLLILAGCPWRGYATVLSVHLDVLTQIADKLYTVVQAGEGPRVEQMAEYVYPAQRARAFLRQFDGFAERPSYRQFAVLVQRYEEMIRAVDAARVQPGALQVVLPRLAADRDALLQLTADIRSHVRAGR